MTKDRRRLLRDSTVLTLLSVGDGGGVLPFTTIPFVWVVTLLTFLVLVQFYLLPLSDVVDSHSLLIHVGVRIGHRSYQQFLQRTLILHCNLN